MSRFRLRLPKSSPHLSLGRKLFFSSVTCLLLLTGVELGWRMANGWNRDWLDCHRRHPVLGWCLREGWAGSSDWTGGYSRINAQGLRDDRPAGPKAPGEKRLLILGDSVTFGGKVQTDQTYPYQLEQALRQAGLPWRVLNGGVASYDPAQEADWLKLFGWKLEPNALAIGFCRNDVCPSDRSPTSDSKAAELASGAVAQWLTEHSIVAFKLQRGLWHLQARLSRLLGKAPGVATLAGSRGGWSFVEQAYRRLAQSACQRHVPVVLIIFPTLPLLEGRATDDLSERLQALGKELGWHVIDLGATFRRNAASLFCPRDSIHPNAAGYKRAAERLFQELTEHGLLP